MSVQLHTTFAEINVHTAKCDTCNERNTLTMYRCMECHQQCCTPCWNSKDGDGKHSFQNDMVLVRRHKMPTVTDEIDKKEAVRKAKKQMRKRKQIVIISDDESETHEPCTNDGMELNPEAKVSRIKDDEVIHTTCNDHKATNPAVRDSYTPLLPLLILSQDLPKKDAAAGYLLDLARGSRPTSIDECGISQLLSAAAEVEQPQFRTVLRWSSGGTVPGSAAEDEDGDLSMGNVGPSSCSAFVRE